MRHSQNLPLPHRIYPPLQQLYAILPEYTPPSQNIPLFQQLYATLPEYTPPSQNIPFKHYILLNIYRLYETPRIYPSLSQNMLPFSTKYRPMRHCQNMPEYRAYPSLPEYRPYPQIFNNYYATLSESTLPSLHLNLPFKHLGLYATLPESRLPLPPRLNPPF